MRQCFKFDTLAERWLKTLEEKIVKSAGSQISHHEAARVNALNDAALCVYRYGLIGCLG